MRILKILGLCVAGLVVVVALLIGAALGYRSHRQHRIADELMIRTPNGIQESQFVMIGGLDQWLQIRGEERGNPVLLFVHGGPAMSMIPFTYRTMRPWEKTFTVVHWDQRGAGRTLLRNGSADQTAANMDQIITDGIAVSDYLRAHLHKDRIIVFGESWGSAIALEMARRRSDLFYAYVGTGQLVDMPRAQRLTYQMLLARVRAQHDDKQLAELVALGPPPYADPGHWLREQEIQGDHPPASERAWGPDFLYAPGYSLSDSIQVIAGASRHRAKLVAEDERYSAIARGTRFEVPILFIQGEQDIQAPLPLVREYLEAISAPSKALVVVPDAGHNGFIFFSQRFLDELNTRVRPLAH